MYKQKNLSQGNVVKQLMVFALPFIISNVIQSLYNVVDMIVVGQFSGTVSMSGVNIGGQITFLMINSLISFFINCLWTYSVIFCEINAPFKLSI